MSEVTEEAGIEALSLPITLDEASEFLLFSGVKDEEGNVYALQVTMSGLVGVPETAINLAYALEGIAQAIKEEHGLG